MLEQANDESIAYTPTEMREAAMLAACMYEERHIRPLFLSKEGFLMSPVDKGGNYRMNPEQTRSRDAMPAPIAAPGAADDAGAGDQTIILTKKADGTVTCDSGDGKPVPYASVDEALDAVKSQLGGGPDDGTDGGAGDAMSGGSESDQVS
jgi:hypothetical protein